VKKVEDLIDSVISALFDGIGIEIPSFGLRVPFLDNLDELVEEARRQLQDFLNFFTGIMDMDGRIDNLIEPILSAIEAAIPSIDFDLGCAISNNTEECFFDALSSFVSISSFPTAIPDLSIGEISFKLPDGLTDIAETFTNEIESIMDNIVNLFEDVGCDRYETLPINIPEFIEDNLTNFTSVAFPIPNCPINVEVCTNLRLPGLESFTEGITSTLNGIISRRNRHLSVDTSNGFERILSGVDDLCQDKWSDDGPFVNGGISIPIPIDDLLRRGSIGARSWSTKIDKIFKLFGKGPTSFRKDFEKAFFHGKVGFPSLKLLMGCDDGEFQAELSLGPLIDMTIGYKADPKPEKQAKSALLYDPGHEDFKVRFQEDIRIVEDVNEILCYLDFIYVTQEMVEWSNLKIPLLPIPSKEVAGYLAKYRSGNLKGIVADLDKNTHYSPLSWNTKRNEILAYQKSWKSVRDDIMQMMEATPCSLSNWFVSKGPACLDLLYENFKPSYTRATEESCGHLYSGYILPKTKTTAEYVYDRLMETSLSVGSYTKLYGDVLPIEANGRIFTSQFEFGNEGLAFNPMAIILKALLRKGFKYSVTLVSLIAEMFDQDNESSSSSPLEDLVESASEGYDYLANLFSGGCMESFIKNNWDFLLEAFVPILPVKTLAGIPAGFEKLKNKLFGETLVKQAKHQSLLDAVIETFNADAKDGLGNPVFYAQQMITEVTFSFVSVTINLVRDEDSTRARTIGFKRKSYICEGRVCFYPFDSDPKAVLDPETKLDTTCPNDPTGGPSSTPSVSLNPSSTPSVSQNPSVSLRPSGEPSENPSSEPSESASPSDKPSESASPSVSGKPSENPSDKPSESSSPSESPSCENALFC